MEEVLVLIVGLVGLGLLVLPIVSVVLASRARKRLRELAADRALDEQKLEYLYGRVKALEARLETLGEAPVATRAAAPAVDPAPEEEPDTAPAAPAEAGPAPAREPRPPALEAPASAPPAAPPPPPEPREPPPPPVPLEERLANLFTRVGAGALVLGVLYFFKYAVDNEWIGPAGRVLAGVVAGVGVLVGAELIRPKTKPGYVHALSGVGLAILYVSAYASAAWYELISIELAFGATAVVLAVGAALAWRYRGEPILVLVLVAGLLTPVLLSTGEDRPLALFSYLLALTSAVLFVAAQRGFRVTIGLAVVGVHVMAFGWYAEFFRVHDWRGEPWAGDRDPAELVGAYRDLTARIVPLAFAALFGAQWTATAFALRRDDAQTKLRFWVTPLATVAAVFLHGAVCALLYDRAPALGVAVLAVGASSVLVMRALDAVRWLLVPMAVAFLVLAGLSQEARGTEQTILLALLAAWTGAYVVAFVKNRQTEGALAPADAIRAQVALHAFAALACLMLLPDARTVEAALVVTLAALPAAFVAARAARPAILLVGSAVNLACFGLVAAVARADEQVAWHPALLGLAVAWGVAHAAAALRDRAEGAERVPNPTLFTLALAVLGPLALGLVSTHASAPTLRALLTAGAGVASLGLAQRLTRRGATAGDAAQALAALSLGLFATAVAFGLSGAPVTVLWAALAAIAGAVLARSHAPVWLVTFQLLVLATGWRLAVVDVAEAERLTRLFFMTQGAEGVLELPALFNPRAYALFGAGVGFLVGAGALARGTKAEAAPGRVSIATLRASAGLVAVLGYALLTTVAVWETRAALSDLPAPPPMALDAAEFDAFWATVASARAATAATLDVATTVVLGLVGIALLAGGFAFGDPFHRYLGLAVLLITVGKLVVWDVWRVSRIYRVVVLTAIGALLLVSGFLYARLKVLFTKGTLEGGAALLLLTLGAGVAHAEGTPPKLATHEYRKVAEVRGVDDPGDYRLVAPPELFAASEDAPRLDDLRLVDAEGHLVPFVFDEVPPERPSRWTDARMYDAGRLEGGATRASFELPEAARHCEVQLDLRTDGPFLRRTRIETGPSQEDLQTVARGAVVYSVRIGDQTFGRADVRYPESAARWVRVTLEPDPDAEPTDIRGARFACRMPAARPPRVERALEVVKVERDEEARTTLVTLDAGQAGLPIDRIEVDVAAPAELVRRVEVQSSAFEQVWPAVGRGVLYRVAGEWPSADLTLSLRPAQKRWFRLVIEDGDDEPLEVTGARGIWRPKELLFRTDAPGPVRLYVGSDRPAAPRFDLQEILRRRVDRPDFRAASLGPLEDNPGFGDPDAGRPLPLTERYRGPIGVGIAVVVVLLGLWAFRLVRSAPQPEKEG